MTIRIQQKSVLPSGQSANVLLDPGTFSAENQARRNFAKGLGDAAATALYFRDLDARKEQSEFEGFVNEQKRQQKLYMTDNPYETVNPETHETETYDTAWQKRIELIHQHKEGLRHNTVKRWADNWMKESKPLWQFEVDQYSHRAKLEAVDIESREKIDAIATQADYAIETDAYNAQAKKMGQPMLTQTDYKRRLIDEIIDKNVASHVWTPQHGAAVREQAEAGFYAAAKNGILLAAREAIDDGATVTQAQNIVWDSEGIEETDKRTLTEMVKSYASTQKAAAEEANYRQKEAFKKELIPLKISDDPIQLQEARDRMVKEGAGILDAKDWEAELDDIDKRIDALSETAGKPFAEVSDDKTYFDVSNVMIGYKNGSIRRETAYQTLIENKENLSESDFNRMKQTFELTGTANDPLKNLTVERALKDLSDLASDYYFVNKGERADKGDKEDFDANTQKRMENTQTFTAIHKAFTDWVEKNPDASDPQILEKYQSLIKPAVEKSFWAYPLSFWYHSQLKPAGWEKAVQQQNLNTQSAADVLDQLSSGQQDTQYINDDYQVGEQQEIDGVLYTYQGNGQWEY